MRRSQQRDTILKIVSSSCDHPTADTVYSRVREEIPNISLGTVYRNLNCLCEMGLVDTLETLDKSIHYDGNTEPHCHFICKECSKIIDLGVIPSIPKAVGDMGLSVDSQKTIYYGICPECRKKI